MRAIPCARPLHWPPGRRDRAGRRGRGGTGLQRPDRIDLGSVTPWPRDWHGVILRLLFRVHCRGATPGSNWTVHYQSCRPYSGPGFHARNLPWPRARALPATDSPRTHAACSRYASRRAVSYPSPNRAIGCRMAVGEADEPGVVRPVAFQQRVTHRAGIESRSSFHGCRITPRDFLMAQGRVEVIPNARLEPVEIDIDEKTVAAGLDAGKRHREQIGQRRPVEPLIADRRSHEGQAERQDRRDPFIERARLRLGGRDQFRRFGLPPEMRKPTSSAAVCSALRTSVVMAVPTWMPTDRPPSKRCSGPASRPARPCPSCTCRRSGSRYVPRRTPQGSAPASP